MHHFNDLMLIYSIPKTECECSNLKQDQPVFQQISQLKALVLCYPKKKKKKKKEAPILPKSIDQNRSPSWIFMMPSNC